MHTISFRGALLFVLLLGTSAQGASLPPSWDTAVRISEQKEDPRTHFRMTSDITPSDSTVPTVVEIPLYPPRPEEAPWSTSAIVVDSTDVVVPSYVRSWATTTRTSIMVTSEVGNGDFLTDRKTTTSITYQLPESRQGLATLLVLPQSEMTMSGVTLTFGRNVTPPTHIEIRARDKNAVETILLSRTKFPGTVVNFLPTRVWQLLVYLEYAQPLEITEVGVIEENPPVVTHYGLRFLAQPNTPYTIFVDPDSNVSLPYQSESNLMGTAGILLTLEDFTLLKNPRYVPADTDGDSVPNVSDNCPLASNADQSDIDGNRIGDTCDDYDKDGLINDKDNCPSLSNYDQRDTDSDGEGDVCDSYENRFTERLPWVPWVGMGLAGLVLIGLFVVVARQTK